jgi:hypothetical protein
MKEARSQKRRDVQKEEIAQREEIAQMTTKRI